ncbi:MAG TPA: BrnT family toxin [Acidobacteriota bacterium]|nr:BrnT family toxin [Acidobacteriota bacterium]
MDVLRALQACTGFDWDDGNFLKNWEKHGVSVAECEQVFFNRPLLAQPDSRHSLAESRFYLLGRTDSGRHLFVAFTVRGRSIRVISARDMSRKEQRSYANYGEESQEDSRT